MNSINNEKKISFLKVQKKIFKNLSYLRKKQLIKLSLLSIVSSLAEAFSLTMLIPFVSVFVNPNDNYFILKFKNILNFFELNSEKEILIFFSLIFIFFLVISGLIRVKYIKYSNYVSEKLSSDLRIKIFNHMLSQNYKFFFEFGSQKIFSNLFQKSLYLNNYIHCFIAIINNFLIISAVTFVLILNQPFYSSILLFTIITFFYLIYKFKSLDVINRGSSINKNQDLMVDIFENAVGYIPEIIIYNLKLFFLSIMTKISNSSAKASAENKIISQTPKIYFEITVLIIAVVLIMIIFMNNVPLEESLPYLAIIVFAAQKTFPLINSIYGYFISMKSSIPSVLSILGILEKNTFYKDKLEYETQAQNKKILFNDKIILKNIFFQYNKNQSFILENISLEINKGSKTLIKGQSGTGKTTLINILSGLLDPSKGEIYIDKEIIDFKNKNDWQNKISIVPQNIFLNDASIAENIAIGQDPKEIDLLRVEKATEIAHINNYIETLPQKYFERVGERGIKLSGGQKQRIALARAIYRKPEVLIMDEPTNALDFNTEKLIINSILGLEKNITIIIISHSHSLTRYFDQIIDLDSLKK